MRRRKNKASSLVESVVAAFIILPIALALVDLIVAVMANQINDTACKNAARAAANVQNPQSTGMQAVVNSLASVKKSPIVENLQLKDYQQVGDSIAVQTEITVKLPVPFPGHSTLVFEAKAVEPIVSK